MLQFVETYYSKFRNSRFKNDNGVVRSVVVAVGVDVCVVRCGHLYKMLISRISFCTHKKGYIINKVSILLNYFYLLNKYQIHIINMKKYLTESSFISKPASISSGHSWTSISGETCFVILHD